MVICHVTRSSSASTSSQLVTWYPEVRVALAIDPDTKLREHACATCGEPFQRVTGFIHNDGNAYAVYFASCYHHGGHEAYIDVVFSKTWDDGLDDHAQLGKGGSPFKPGRDPGCFALTTRGTQALLEMVRSLHLVVRVW